MGTSVDVIALPKLSSTVPEVTPVTSRNSDETSLGTTYVPVITDGSSASTDMTTSTEPIVTVFDELGEIASLICATIVKVSPTPTTLELMSSPEVFRTLKLVMLGGFMSIPVTGSSSAI